MSFVKEKGGCCLKERKKKRSLSSVKKSFTWPNGSLLAHLSTSNPPFYLTFQSFFFCVFEIETGGEDPFVVNPRHFHHLFPGKQERERKKKKCEKMYRHNNSKQSVVIHWKICVIHGIIILCGCVDMAHASPATFLPVRSSFTTTPVQSSPSYLDVDRCHAATLFHSVMSIPICPSCFFFFRTRSAGKISQLWNFFFSPTHENKVMIRIHCFFIFMPN